MVIDSNRVNIFFVLRFVTNNHTVRCVGIVSYIKHTAVLGTTIVVCSDLHLSQLKVTNSSEILTPSVNCCTSNKERAQHKYN